MPPLGDMLWLAGVSVVTDGGMTHQFLADKESIASERLAVAFLADVLGPHRDLPVVTWSGESADCPVLRKAAARCGMADPMEGRWHVDLYRFAERALRLPTPRLKLKDLADYFQIPRRDDIESGTQAVMTFKRLVATSNGQQRRRLEKQLLDYNKDDIDVLVGVTDELRIMTAALPPPKFP